MSVFAQVQPTGDVTAKLNELRRKVEAGKMARARAEADLENVKRQEEQLLAELQALGVAPEALDAEIQRCETEITRLLAEAESMLTGVA